MVVVARVVAGKYSPSHAVVRVVLLFVTIVMWQGYKFFLIHLTGRGLTVCDPPGGERAT